MCTLSFAFTLCFTSLILAVFLSLSEYLSIHAFDCPLSLLTVCADARSSVHRIAAMDTVSVHFVNQLGSLMDALATTSPQFVRCVKPNALQEPNNFDSRLVLHQLRYMGVLDTIRVRRLGYPVRKSFDDIARTYMSLTGDKAKAMAALATGGSKVVACDIMARVLGRDNTGQWQCGTDRIFMRNGIVELLDVALAVRRLVYVVAVSMWAVCDGQQRFSRLHVAHV
jgi:myosin heavy subunit